MAISRQKRPLIRTSGMQRDASLFIIATEGEKTEPIYFDMFRSNRLQVVPLASLNGESSPDHVLRRVVDFKKKFQFGAGDTFWLVIDRDRWTVKMVSQVHARCRASDVSCLVSNPNFEIWLAFHFENPLPHNLGSRSLGKHLKSEMGQYSKNRYATDQLLARAPQACLKAREVEVRNHDLWPEAPGSDVYRLVEAIMQKL